MPRGNSKESQRWAYRVSSILFPVAKCMDANADCGGELDLRQPHKSAQRRHVHHQHLGARRAEEPCGLVADPPAGAGDDSHLVVESIHLRECV